MDAFVRCLAPLTPAKTTRWEETSVAPGLVHFHVEHSDGTILDAYRFAPPAIPAQEADQPPRPDPLRMVRDGLQAMQGLANLGKERPEHLAVIADALALLAQLTQILLDMGMQNPASSSVEYHERCPRSSPTPSEAGK